MYRRQPIFSYRHSFLLLKRFKLMFSSSKDTAAVYISKKRNLCAHSYYLCKALVSLHVEKEASVLSRFGFY